MYLNFFLTHINILLYKNGFAYVTAIMIIFILYHLLYNLKILDLRNHLFIYFDFLYIFLMFIYVIFLYMELLRNYI
jgi:hypothetical protein